MLGLSGTGESPALPPSPPSALLSGAPRSSQLPAHPHADKLVHKNTSPPRRKALPRSRALDPGKCGSTGPLGLRKPTWMYPPQKAAGFSQGFVDVLRSWILSMAHPMPARRWRRHDALELPRRERRPRACWQEGRWRLHAQQKP